MQEHHVVSSEEYEVIISYSFEYNEIGVPTQTIVRSFFDINNNNPVEQVFELQCK